MIKRMLFTLAAATSLVLFLATAAMWARVAGRRELKFGSDTTHYQVRSVNYLLVLRVEGGVTMPEGYFRSPPGTMWDLRWANPTHYLGLGIWYGRSPANDPTAAPYFGLVVPVPLLLSTTALLPAAWLWLTLARHRDRRRAARLNLCPACGYDLRASPTRCPECGRAADIIAAAGSEPA